MAPLSLKIILDDGAVTRTVKFDSSTQVVDAHAIIKEKILTADDNREYALFLTSANDDKSGIWLEGHRPLDYYMLRDGDSLLYIHKQRNLRVKMLDGTVKTLQVDESKCIGDLMRVICTRIGITNHEEYGLCHENCMEPEDPKENRPVTGTLTLKRKRQEKERDAKMDELSKKLKSDDNVAWLDQHKTLRELGVDSTETLLLKRRLFYSDRNIDSRDPFQLNLLYVQTKDAILCGHHPVTEDQALEFAALQCQIHFGDFQEDKHKPGLIENLKECLPEQYATSWGAEKKILKLWRKHAGLSAVDAKYLYTKTARELPTYGVTFFVVKEKQKGKKKMVPRLLGINAESILRLDEVTKEVLQVWPLTHLKTYHAHTNDTFTLNFGDYSDKPYSVKTQDAIRIREVLEGYIDIIRKRLCAPHTRRITASGEVIEEDSVQSSRGNVMTHIVNTPVKVVETSYVGPTKIVPFEQGQQASTGTQVMTVQQVITTRQGSTKQEVMSGEVPMRSDMCQELVKKLNRLNSNAVKVVTLLAEPNDGNIRQARSLFKIMEEDMPIVEKGVRESAEKQTSAEARKKLLAELDELMALLAGASQEVKRDTMNPEQVSEQARQIADLTTQMYFSLDPRTQRRSMLVRRSRDSFIADEKTAGAIRRASLIAAAGSASHAADTAAGIIAEKYRGAALSDREVEQLEASAVDKMGKLNAAVALFLTSHADSNNIDYEAAVNSMNTIKELLPELATDAKAISQCSGDELGKEISDELKALIEAARRVCMLTGCEDHEKIQEVAHSYADVSGRLVYVIGSRNPRVNADKENEIVNLAKDVGDATTLLLMEANSLTEAASSEPGATAVDTEGVACAAAARKLIACAQLTAPTIREPHCQSALTASAENLSAAAQKLAVAWRPLVDIPQHHRRAEPLTARTLDLARALDRLKQAYADLGDVEMQDVQEQISPEEARKILFIANISSARDNLKTAQEQLDMPIKPANLNDHQMNELQDNISQKLAQTNAAVASLLQAKSDPQNPDYGTAELAISTIAEVTPDVVKNTRALLSSCGDERARQAMLSDVRAWCQGCSDVCASSASDDPKELDEAAKRFAKASKKLSFVFSPLARKAREQLMMELFNSAHKQAMQMVDDTNKMADTMGGAGAARLRELGHTVHDSAAALQTTLMVTAPTLDEERCKSALLSSSAGLKAAAERLTCEAESLQDDETGCRILSAKLQAQRADITQHGDELQKAIDAIRQTLEDSTSYAEQVETPAQKVQRLKFVTSAAAVSEKAHEAELLLEKPVNVVKLSSLEAKELETKRARELAAVNAAIALLIHSRTDRNNPNYSKAEEAIATVSTLMPDIIQDTASLSSVCADEAARASLLEEMRAWCGAVQAVCAGASHADLTEFVDSAQRYADTSNKLSFVFNTRKVSPKEQEVLQLTASACNTARQMVEQTRVIADELPATQTQNAALLCVRAAAMDDAQRALLTTAQLTASSLEEPHSRSALVASSSQLGDTAEDLVIHSLPLTTPHCSHLTSPLLAQKQELDKALSRIKATCAKEGNLHATMKEHQQKIATSAAAAEQYAKEAAILLDQPATVKMGDQQTKLVQDNLSRSMAEVNAAIASLINATSNSHQPDLITAEKSIETISGLIPVIIEDTRDLSSTCGEDHVRAAMIEDARAWCSAVQAVCASAAKGDDQELKESAQNFAKASHKLRFVVTARQNPVKEQQITQLSNSACDKARQMVEEMRRTADVVKGDEGDMIMTRAANLNDAAAALHTTAQLTAPSINEPQCRAAFLSSVDHLASSAGVCVRDTACAKHPASRRLSEELSRYTDVLDRALHGLRSAVSEEPRSRGPPPPPPKRASISRAGDRRSSGAAGVPHSPRVRVVSHSDSRRASQEWLQHMREDASKDIEATMPPGGLSKKEIEELNKKAEAEKLAKKMFETAVDKTHDSIATAQQEIEKLYTSTNEGLLLDVDQAENIQKQMEIKLASAQTAAAMLVSSSHPDVIDYATATKATDVLSELMPDIVKDAGMLSSTRDENSKRVLLDHIQALCNSTNRLVGTAKRDNMKVNEAAVEFGDMSAGLLYAVGTEVDPAQEKEVISQAHAIGDASTHLAERVVSLAGSAGAPHVSRMCDAGRQCADAARALVYSAKLIAPSVHHQECQNYLIKASHELSSQLKNLSSTWKPLASEPAHVSAAAELTKEAQHLEKLLEGFRQDLASGKLVKRREVHKIVIEDTPLRQLASRIMELAQLRAESGNTPDDKKRLFSEYHGCLRAAIKQLDVASARAQQYPHDLTRHQNLEAAVQNLQISLLQGRPSLGDQPHNNVVDLTDFVKDTSKKAEKLLATSNKTDAPKDKKQVDSVKEECHKINLSAFRLLNPGNRQDGDETSLDGILEVDQFGQECENRVNKIKETIEAMEQKKTKDLLHNNTLTLIESCSFLRFATKSALATADSAALDEALDELIDLEKRLDKMMVLTDCDTAAGKHTTDPTELFKARSRLIEAASGVTSGSGGAVTNGAGNLPPALLAYTTVLRQQTQLADTHQRNKSLDHLKKVTNLLKELVARTSTRVATWRPLPCAELAALTEQFIQELDTAPFTVATDGEKKQAKVLDEKYINRLLMPVDVRIEGEPKAIEEKLHQAASKLVMLSGTLSSSAGRPDSLARTACAVTDAALQLHAAASSTYKQNLAHEKRTEEACREMCWATYNMLRVGEQITRETEMTHGERDALKAAAAALTEAVNKLARTACTGDKLNVQCHENTRALQSMLSRIQLAPTAAPPYNQCLQQVQAQMDVIQKLNSDEPMPRAEFIQSLDFVTAAVCNSTEYAAQATYLLSLSEQNMELAIEGVVDVPRLQKLTSAMQESCYIIMRSNQEELIKEEENKLSTLNQELQLAVKEAAGKVKDTPTKRELTECAFKLDHAVKALNAAVCSNASMDKITSATMTVVDAMSSLKTALGRPSLLPHAQLTAETQALCDDVTSHSKKLISTTQALIKEVKNADDDLDPMTWVTYNTQRKSIVDAFEALLNSIKRNGEKAGVVEVTKEEEEPDVPKKSFMQIQEETARKWLQRRPSTAGVQEAGVEAANTLVDIAQQMSEDMKGNEKEEIVNLITESKRLIAECSTKYDNDTASALMDSLKEIRRAMELATVTLVVEELLHTEEPLADLDILLDAERDEAKRKFLLEKKIAELMCDLGRVTRTARVVSRAARNNTKDLDKCTEQTELLAPQLVKAAQERVASPNDAKVIENYKQLLAQYTESLAKVREHCDRAVDPLDFVQCAGETMARMREDSSQQNDPKLCAYTSSAITRLAERVIVVSMSSEVARSDAELRAALVDAQEKLAAATPAPGTRESRMPDWKDTTAEILRTTGEVESALGGENIFKKLPVPDQPIYNAALSLHSAVRGWSARDNEIVAVAKRMAVLMARLSEQMNTERKRELIVTSKNIVTESREVAALAKKIAHECTDVRIKTNLLQVCERIPTISGQLKMLTVVKGSTLGNMGGEEDREAMNMLVTNAQNLMSSVQEVVKAAASASVKIASQRGNKWVKKNY